MTASTDSPGEGWREALRGYLTDAAPTPGHAPTTGLALQFELREVLVRTAHRWNGPVSKGARPSTNGALTGSHRLGIRPTAATPKGWARGGLTWTNLPHLINRLHLDPAQHRWCCELGALDRATRPATAGRDPGWIFLDDFANPVLWALLNQAAGLGVPLVGVGAGAQVDLGGPATINLDVVRGGDQVTVAPRVAVDGAAVDPAQVRPIGDHGLYVIDPARPRQILLAPAATPLSTDDRALLRSSATVVPEREWPEFVDNFLPDLRERLEVGSSDGSVALPEPTPPVLVATIAYGARHTTTIGWAWDRRRGAPTTPDPAELLAGLIPQDWLGDDPPAPQVLHGLDAADFAASVLPGLEAAPGIRIETQGRAPQYRELTGTPRLTVTAVPSEKHDWFDLAVTVTIDEVTVPFVPLFKALAKGRRRLLLVDGSYLSLSHPALADLAALIAESIDISEWEPTPTLSLSRIVSSWSDFEDLADQAAPAVQWRALVREIRHPPTPVTPPAILTATLRPYQQQGLDWLAFLWRHRLGGILADDMGLGKTVQCLALIAHARETSSPAAPFLVVAPTSVVPNWVSEADRFVPDLAVVSVPATEAAAKVRLAELAHGADIVITSYPLLRLDADVYAGIVWAGVILDEAQFVKNADAKVHQAALDLTSPFKLAVTGTPLENSLTDLWALTAIVAPGLFPSEPRFLREYVRPIEGVRAGITRGVGAGRTPEVTAAMRAERLDRLRRRIRPFLLRRNKSAVAAELPQTQEQTLRIALAPEHRELYEVYLHRERQKLFHLLDDLEGNKFIVFRSLTLLRLLALDAGLIDAQYAAISSPKLDALVEMLTDISAEGHRALVFSQFTSYLDIVEKRLTAEGLEFLRLDGSTRRRGEVVRRFQDGTAPIFLISLKAGGFGLNLAGADYVFLLDPWWNPAAEAQAIDRAHRIGQDKHVMVYRLVAADTIEDKVLALGARKSALFDAVVDGESGVPSGLDLRELLRTVVDILPE